MLKTKGGTRIIRRGHSTLPLLASILHEFIFTLSCVGIYSSRKIGFTIAVDPLNFLYAYVLKKLGMLGRIYFHSVDYSQNRFRNRLLNVIYESSYRFAITKADTVGVVSARMKQKALDYGVESHRVFLLPNTPLDADIAPVDLKARLPKSIVHSGFSFTIDFDKFLNVLAQLKGLIGSFEVHLIGDANLNPAQQQFVSDNGLHETLIFHGFLDRAQNLKVISQCMVGVTYYDYSDLPHMRYADSQKIREYLYMGLPVVSEGLTWTAEEAYVAGAALIFRNEREMARELASLLTDDLEYQRMSANAQQLGRKYEKGQLLEELIGRLVGSTDLPRS